MIAKKIKISFLCLLMILLFSGFAFGYQVLINTQTKNFEYKRTVTIQGGQVPAAQSNFPMLFDSKTDPSDLQLDLKTQPTGKVRSASGYDIVFATADGVEILKHEIEKYVASTGEYVAWVKVNLTGSDQDIYLYYGSDDATSNTQHVTDVWDTDYGAVWHLKETGSSTTVTYYFNAHSASAWNNAPQFNDNNLGSNAWIMGNGGNLHEFSTNTCPGNDLGDITKVELRVGGATWNDGGGEENDDMMLRPVFSGASNGDNHQIDMPVYDPEPMDWSAWTEITNDTNAPSPWTWSDVVNLDCDAWHVIVPSQTEYMLGAACQIRVTYTSGGTDAIKNSTSYSNDGTDYGVTLGATGKMDGAVYFDGDTDYIPIPSPTNCSPPNYFTASAWIKVNSTDSGEIVSRGDSYAIRLYSSGQIQFSIYRSGSWDNKNPAGQEITDFNEFHYIACGVNNTGSFYAIDGVNLQQQTDTGTIGYSLGTTVEIGRHGNGSSSYDFSGTIDEVRISTVGRSDDWIATEYNNQYTPGTFYSVGDPFPTLVKLSYFRAKALYSRVVLEWATETELDNEGFNILRSEVEDGEYVRINPYLIPARGSAGFGAEYSYTDYDVENGVTYYYLLEDIDFYGVSTLHGPVSATPNDIIIIWPIDWEPLPSGYSLFSWTSSGNFSFKVDVSTNPSFPDSKTLSFPEEGWTSGLSLWLRPEEWELILRKAQASGGHLFWRIRAKSQDGEVVCSNWKRFIVEK